MSVQPPARTRLMAKVVRVESGCWEWTGLIVDGYGRVGYRGVRGFLAHRAVYEELVGPIPAGLTLDHVCHSRDDACDGGSDCRHRRCVNPSHLEPVTFEENASRSIWARKTVCPKGHPYAGDNLRVAHGRRFCIKCSRDRARAQHARRRQAVAS